MKEPEFSTITMSHEIDPNERSRRLSRVYQLILSWDLPENKPEPATEDLVEDAVAGSEETPAYLADALIVTSKEKYHVSE